MFAATVAYSLPEGSRTLVDRIGNPSPNGNDTLDRMHVHVGPGAKDPKAFAAFMATFAETLAADPALLRVRLHLPQAYDNADLAPPAQLIEELGAFNQTAEDVRHLMLTGKLD